MKTKIYEHRHRKFDFFVPINTCDVTTVEFGDNHVFRGFHFNPYRRVGWLVNKDENRGK